MSNKYSLLFLALLVSALVVISFAGCSNQTNTTPAASVTTPVQTTVATPKPSPTPIQPAASSTPAQAVTLNISVAASLTDVLKAINTLYTSTYPNVTLTPNFASSGTLQTQIENGAPSDIFISAAAAQMGNLQKENLILTGTRKNLLYNSLVMVVPIDSTLGLTSFNDMATPKVTKVAIGDPKSVPCGTYTVKAFDELGITAQVQPKEILGADVRGVLTYVESGNVDAGFVYSTDALTSTKVKVVASAPADINSQIVYPAAVIQASKNPNVAKDYLNFLFSDQARVLFVKYGFTMATN